MSSLSAVAQQFPDRAAVILADTGRTATYRELDERSAALARVFRAAGLQRGDVVAALTDNSAEAFEIYWATQRSGLYLTAVNRHLSPEEVAYIVRDSEAKALLASAGIAELAAQVAELVEVDTLRLAFGGDVAGFDSYEKAIAAADGEQLEESLGAMMLYSSGTTGRPKGVRMPLPAPGAPHASAIFAGLVSAAFGLGPDTVYYSPAPIYHAAPLNWGSAVHVLGGTVVMPSKFDAERTLRDLEEYKVTAAQLVPTMFVRLLKLPYSVQQDYDLIRLRALVHAAAPCPPDVKRAMIDWVGPILYEYYSSTESNGLTVIDTEQWRAHPGSVGRAVLGTVRICDDEGKQLPTGEIGTVYFERDELPFRYHHDDEKTSAAQHPDHPTWTTVGDVGYLDEDGYLYLTDRKAFVIISGGVNIYPQEVENVLALHPAVADAAVIGIPDADMGEQVKAVVQLEPGHVGSSELADELIDYVRARIARYKAPKSVDFVHDLPRTPTGKLVKGPLKARYAAH